MSVSLFDDSIKGGNEVCIGRRIRQIGGPFLP